MRFELHVPINIAMPKFFKGRDFKDITSIRGTAFQKAFDTDLSAFEYMTSHPELAASLAFAMALQNGSSWLDFFPVETVLGEFSPDPEEFLFVDVGGGVGHQALAFKEKYPGLVGRVVVQDLAIVALSIAKPVDNVEFMEHDFLKEQPIKGARIYFLRKIMHDWPDNDCVAILSHTAEAMGPDSRLLIDEMIVPETGISWETAYMDVTMMASHGGGERTMKEYGQLLDQSGLKIEQVHQYDSRMTSIIVAVLR